MDFLKLIKNNFKSFKKNIFFLKKIKKKSFFFYKFLIIKKYYLFYYKYKIKHYKNIKIFFIKKRKLTTIKKILKILCF